MELQKYVGMLVCCRNFPALRSCLGAQRLTSILFIDIGLLVYRHIFVLNGISAEKRFIW